MLLCARTTPHTSPASLPPAVFPLACSSAAAPAASAACLSAAAGLVAAFEGFSVTEAGSEAVETESLDAPLLLLLASELLCCLPLLGLGLLADVA